jgi:hypothetical protein
MSLPAPAPRAPKHTRTITLQGFERDDGLWDIEGHIVDVKPFGFDFAGGSREAGDPIHEMRVRVTIDTDFKIHDAVATSERKPYPGQCDATLPDYRKLIGMNLARGFRRAVLEQFGQTRGCTHITELLTHLPSAAYQTMSALPELYSANEAHFAVGRCVALKPEGEVVRRYYPLMYTGKKPIDAQ